MLSEPVKYVFKNVLILGYWVDLFDFVAVTDADGILRFLFGLFFLVDIIRSAKWLWLNGIGSSKGLLRNNKWIFSLLK